MNKLLWMTTLVGALGASAMTSAQPRRGVRPPDATNGVVVVRRTKPRPSRYEPVSVFPDRPRRHRERAARDHLYAERQDLRQIVDIARDWRRATAGRDPYRRLLVDQRLDRWLAREIREGRNRPNSYHRRRIIELSRQLDALHWRFGHGPLHRVDPRRKALILDELVALSEARVRHAAHKAYASDRRRGRPLWY
ncbi:MAG: hypothetical protein AAF500_09205 [Myxococcota bacterium]